MIKPIVLVLRSSQEEAEQHAGFKVLFVDVQEYWKPLECKRWNYGFTDRSFWKSRTAFPKEGSQETHPLNDKFSVLFSPEPFNLNSMPINDEGLQDSICVSMYVYIITT